METAGSRSGSVDQLQKRSNVMVKAARKLKSPVSDADSIDIASKESILRSAKGGERKVSSEEKKKAIKDIELESQLTYLQEFKKAREQLRCCEALNLRYQQEIEEAKRRFSAMSMKLNNTEKQLDELLKSEEDRVQELCKIAHERDKAWQSELDAVKQQHLNDMSILKLQLEKASQFDACQAAEVHSLRTELQETLLLAEDLKLQLNSTRETEARAIRDFWIVQRENEVIKTSEEVLKLELAKALESYKSLSLELEELNNKESSSENTGNLLQIGEEEEESEICMLKNEIRRLRTAVKEAERKYHNEYIHSTLEIRNAYQLLEEVKSAYRSEEVGLKGKLNESMAEVEELRKILVAMENNGQRLNQEADRESELELKLKKSELSLENLSASLLEKDVEMQRIIEQNEQLKTEISKTKNDQCNVNEVLMNSISEQNRSFRHTDHSTKELDAARELKTEIEAELGRVKVQCDQWRKAAEAAVAMLTAGNNEKHGERLSPWHISSLGRKTSSMQLELVDDDSPKNRNTTMLKKITVLLKKGQK